MVADATPVASLRPLRQLASSLTYEINMHALKELQPARINMHALKELKAPLASELAKSCSNFSQVE